MLHLERDMGKLKKEILHLGNLVESAIDNAIQALHQRDSAYSDKVFELEKDINNLEVSIEEDCLKILALHQPVAVDLRFIVVALKVNNDLERMGDFATNIAKRAVQLLHDEPLKVIPEYVETLPETVSKMVSGSLDALVRMDTDKAAEIIQLDDIVDDINRQMYREVTRIIKEDSSKAETAINLLSTSRYMERIADLSTNIAEEVIFMVKGDVVRHGS